MEKQLDNHYTDMGIEPIVYSDSNNLDPYQHTIIKYVTRFRAKGGLRDLKAAALLLQKYIDKEEALLIPDEKTALDNLIRDIKNSNKAYDRIVTSGRGGLWSAANLGYALSITQVETMPLHQINQLSADNILFVDDIVDTGKTIQSIIIDSATLYSKNLTSCWPTFTGVVVHTEEYIDLPISQMFDKENK